MRLQPRERALLRRAAQRLGVTESAFIREAITQRAETVLGDTLAERLKDIIGSVHGKGPSVAHRTSEAFGEMLEEEAKRWRRPS